MTARAPRNASRLARRVARLLASLVAVLCIAAAVPLTVAAAAPTITRESFEREFEFLDCPTFTVWGAWRIDRTITVWSDAGGQPIRDRWHVEFRGRLFNPLTGASVADWGVREFFDQLAPDGSIASTRFTFERTNAFVHEAGMALLGPSDSNGDQPTLRQVGHDGFTAANIAALCAAIDGA